MTRAATARRAAIALVAAAVFAAGCGDQARDQPRAEATAPATHAPATPAPPQAPPATPAPPQAPPARAVHFRAADGKRVVAQYVPAGEETAPAGDQAAPAGDQAAPAGDQTAPARDQAAPARDQAAPAGYQAAPAGGGRAPAVVLLHEIRGGPDQWDPLVPYVHAAGFATLAYASRSSTQERDRIRDLLGAVDWLRRRPDVDRRRLALVGASIGASTTVYAMASGTQKTVAAAVALSPPDSADIWRLQDSHRYRPHDLLMVSDDRASASVDGMMHGAIRSTTMRSEHTGHGVVLLGEPQIRAALLDWLKTRVG